MPRLLTTVVIDKSSAHVCCSSCCAVPRLKAQAARSACSCDQDGTPCRAWPVPRGTAFATCGTSLSESTLKGLHVMCLGAFSTNMRRIGAPLQSLRAYAIVNSRESFLPTAPRELATRVPTAWCSCRPYRTLVVNSPRFSCRGQIFACRFLADVTNVPICVSRDLLARRQRYPANLVTASVPKATQKALPS